MAEFNAERIAELTVPSYTPPEITNLAATIKDKVAAVDFQAPPKDSNPYNPYYFGKNIAAPVKGSLEVTNYNIDDAYQVLNDGSYIAKYDTYKAGRNNAEYFGQTQSTGDKWINGVTKALGKVGTAVLGGTIGIVNGVGAAIEDGSLTALYDNDFTRTLDDWNTKMDYKLPNYYTQQEQDKGLFGQAATANFWSDKVLGGLSFTAGAIVSESLWAYATGGYSVGTAAARWGTKALGFSKVAQGINTYKGILKAPLIAAYRSGQISKTTAVALGRAGDVFNTARFALTSAGYEASVEALQYKKEATENFYNDFEQLNGRPPVQEDIQEFELNLTESANAVFGLNMAIVGSSNIATLGNIFKLRNPINTGITDFIEKKAFGRGIASTIDDAGKTVFKPIEATRGQRIARNIFDYGKAPIVEGLYEEGGQGVVSKTAKKWIEHSYNPQLTTENAEMAGLVYESLSEQYGTKEGWVENGIGMIIGAIGGSFNAAAGRNRINQEIEYRAAGMNTFQEKVIQERFLLANRTSGFNQEAQQEEQKGNIVKSRIATDGVLHSRLNHAYQLGENLNSVVEEARVALDAMTPQQFEQAGIPAEEIDSFKEQSIKQYKDVAKQFKQNRAYAEYVIGKSRVAGIEAVTSEGSVDLGTNSQEAIVQSLTWTLTAGENAGALMQDLNKAIAGQVGAEQTTVLNTVAQIKKQTAAKRGQLTKNVNKRKALITERDRLQTSLIEVQNAPKETEGDRVQGAELGQLNIRLIELNSTILDLDDQIQSFADELNSQKQYQSNLGELNLSQVQDFSSLITVEDLTNLGENVKKFESLIQSFETSNPQRHQYLQDLLDEYAQAEDIFLTNQSTALMLSSGKMGLKNISGWLSKQVNKGKQLDEVTKDWLVDILKKYQQNKVAALNSTIETEETISDEEYNDFIDNGNVSEEFLETIAAKVKNRERLSPREQAIFTDRTAEINEIIKQTPVARPQTFNEEQFIRDNIQRLEEDNYLLTHITADQDAVDIYNGNFSYSMGNGLSSTTVLEGAQSVIEKINNLRNGRSPHRGLTGLAIFAIPKSFFNKDRVDYEDIENYIIENYPDAVGENLSIPNEFNAAYLTNGQLNIRGVERQQTPPAPQETLTPTEQLKQRLSNLLKTGYNSLTYIGENYDELYLKKPTKAEIEEYRSLRNEDIDNERFQFLQEKLGNWRLLDSAVTEENQSIVDLVELIDQLETVVEQENTQDELTLEDIATVAQSDKDGVTTSMVRYDLAQNTLGSVTVQYLKDKGIYKFSHIKMSSIIDKMGLAFDNPRLSIVTADKKPVKRKLKQADFEDYRPGTVFHIDNTRITIGTGNTIEIKAEDYVTLRDTLNLHITVPSINWSYFDVYEYVGENGEMQKRPSDFQEDINPALLYEVKPEDELGLRIANDSYNQRLRDRVLNEEMTPELEAEIQNSLKIYITYKGQPVSTLKGTNTSVAPSDTFLLLRETAKNAFISDPTTPVIKGTIKARKVFLGSPQITQSNIEITPTALQNIIATGYISESGEVVVNREVGDVDKTYISGFKDKTKKIPVVVFKKGAYTVVYPVTLVKSPNPQAESITMVVENPTMSETDKIKAINQRIIETGIASDKRLAEYDLQKIETITEEFAAHQTFVSMADFANPAYRFQNLIADVQINIDLDNLDKTISDPKLEIDLSSIEVVIARADKYESLVEIEDRLSEIAIELNNDYTRNAEEKYTNSKGEIVEDTVYTDVFDEGMVETNPTSHTHKIKNVNAVAKAFSEKLPKVVKNALSSETIQEVEFLLKKYSLFKTQVTPNREIAEKSISQNSCN